MARNHEPGPGQEPLPFEEGAPTPEAHDVYYPSVSIAERAIALDAIFDHINTVRRADGLQKISEHPDRRVSLEARYGSQTSNVLRGSAEKADDRERVAKELFAKAAGLPQMERAGMDDTQAKAIVRQEYRRFSASHGFGQANKKVRDDKQFQIAAAEYYRNTGTKLTKTAFRKSKQK